MNQSPQDQFPASVFAFSGRGVLALVKCGLAGGVACWLPTVIVQAVVFALFQNVEIQFLAWSFPTIALPLGAVMTVRALERRRLTLRPWLIPAGVCAGLWILGPAAMTIESTAAVGSFVTGAGALNKVRDLLWATVRFPATTFMMSAYLGSLFGVLITTAVMAMWCWWLRRSGDIGGTTASS